MSAARRARQLMIKHLQEEGRLAALAGKLRSACPFSMEQDRRQWLAGFSAGESELPLNPTLKKHRGEPY